MRMPFSCYGGSVSDNAETGPSEVCDLLKFAWPVGSPVSKPSETTISTILECKPVVWVLCHPTTWWRDPQGDSAKAGCNQANYWPQKQGH